MGGESWLTNFVLPSHYFPQSPPPSPPPPLPHPQLSPFPICFVFTARRNLYYGVLICLNKKPASCVIILSVQLQYLTHIFSFPFAALN